MPRPKKAGAPQAKTRSRNGCWPCKARKVKCDETRPSCQNCHKQGESCDYSIRLNWDGRGKKRSDDSGGPGQISFSSNLITSQPSTRKLNGLEGSEALSSTQYDHSTVIPRSPILVPPQRDGLLHANLVSQNTQAENNYLLSPQHSQSTQVLDDAIDPLLVDHGSRRIDICDSTAYEQSSDPSGKFYSQSYERYHSMQPNLLQTAAASRARELPFITGIPSPSESIQSPGTAILASSLVLSTDTPISTPPGFQVGPYGSPDAVLHGLSPERPSKRIKQVNTQWERTYIRNQMLPPFPSSNTFDSNPYSLNSSSGHHDTIMRATSRSPLGSSNRPLSASLGPSVAQNISEPRRLSVESLLSGPPGIPAQKSPQANHWTQDMFGSNENNDGTEQMTTYGIDRGFKDLDIGKNDDANALTGGSPVALREHVDMVDSANMPNEFGFGVRVRDTAFGKGGYYSRPVQIEIPTSFEPLPALLLENPQNILYFHHFIAHTARILVPHHCSSNPFRKILPRMALQDNDLLSLLLAYSASHRARLLQQPEPATRIALWVQDVFPNLRHALNDPKKIVSNANLASAIMLCSLEIISPKAFGISVPWQDHLHTARQMIDARGGVTSMHLDRSPTSYFLLRWFGYLDVLGSLMGSNAGPSSTPGQIVAFDYAGDDDHDYQIDCLLGFTGRCISILGKIAELAHACATERLQLTAEAQKDWSPSEEITGKGSRIAMDLHLSRTNTRVQHCPHLHSTGESAFQWDHREISATNEAYHWAGAIHIHRRILGKSSTHPDVQNAVREIIGTLYKVRKGSTAEACLLFPMFTAGCDAQEDKQRAIIMDRMKGVEEFGMSQVSKARTLMQKVWDTGKPWEALAAGEFVG